MTEQEREDELKANQGGRVYPLGRALRSTFDADNHDSLGSDVTGLMIDLSRVPYEPGDVIPPVSPVDAVPVAAAPPAAPRARSWRARLGDLFGRRSPA